MNHTSTTMSLTTLLTTVIRRTALSIISISINNSMYKSITKLLNGTDLYKYRVVNLIEPEKCSFSTRKVFAKVNSSQQRQYFFLLYLDYLIN